MIRRILVFIIAATATFGFVHPAVAQNTTTTCSANQGDIYSCGNPGFILTPPTVSQGGQVTISGQGCAANQTVEFSINGQVIGTTVTDVNGNFTVTLTLPSNLTPGTYTIIGTCGNITMSNTITITGGGNSGQGNQGGTGTTPITGSGLTEPLTRAGIALVLVGGLALAVSRRRREPEPSHS